MDCPLGLHNHQIMFLLSQFPLLFEILLTHTRKGNYANRRPSASKQPVAGKHQDAGGFPLVSQERGQSPCRSWPQVRRPSVQGGGSHRYKAGSSRRSCVLQAPRLPPATPVLPSNPSLDLFSSLLQRKRWLLEKVPRKTGSGQRGSVGLWGSGTHREGQKGPEGGDGELFFLELST